MLRVSICLSGLDLNKEEPITPTFIKCKLIISQYFNRLYFKFLSFQAVVLNPATDNPGW